MSQRLLILRRLGLGLAALLLGAQLIRPALDNRGEAEGPRSFTTTLKPPAAVRGYLENSCYDCHSNSTNYPWYAQVQPLGWIIARHVHEGKRTLNFTTFGTLSKHTQLARLEYMMDSINERDMPYWPYRLFRPHAKWSEVQITAVTSWIRSTIAANEAPLKSTVLASP